MTDQHPITPPPELVREWYIECPESNEAALVYVATQAARWGADQELEACCKLLELSDTNAREFLYSARRPQPQPSLKEQALALLREMRNGWIADQGEYDLLETALRQQPEGPAVTPAADTRGPGSVAEQASPVATDEELESRYVGAHGPNLPGVLRAIYDLGYEHGSQDIEAIEGAPVPPDAAAPDRPLWVEMRDVYSDPSRIHWSGHGFARELRVVADWLERREPYNMDAVLALRAEAERAEAGK